MAGETYLNDASADGSAPETPQAPQQPIYEEDVAGLYWVDVGYDESGNMVNYKDIYGNVISGNQLPEDLMEGQRWVNNVPQYSGDKAAQQTRAWIANSEWQDYQSRFAPREEQLVNRLSNEGGVEEINRRLGEIRGTARTSFANSLGDTLRKMQRYGIGNNVSEEARTQMVNEAGAGAARSMIDAENNVRQHVTDRNMNMIAGSGDVIHRDYDYGN